MVNPDPDQLSPGPEHPPLEDSAPPPDAGTVDFPTDPGYPAPGYQQPGYPPPGYQPAGYPPPGYPQAEYPPPGYPPPAMPGPPYQQYPGRYPAYDPYRPPRPPGTNGKAITSLVASLAGLVLFGLPSVAGLILGIMAMRETKSTGQDGHGLALAGVIVGALAVAAWLLYAIVIIIAAIVFVSTSPAYY